MAFNQQHYDIVKEGNLKKIDTLNNGLLLNDERLELENADLSGAKLNNAELNDANLSRAKLNDAKLNDANLSGAVLKYANLNNAELDHANLRGANLRGANLSGAVLKYANLRGANLSGAVLEYANLIGANLRGANLSGADLRNTDTFKHVSSIDGVILNKYTQISGDAPQWMQEMKKEANNLADGKIVQLQGDNKQYDFVVGTMVDGKFVAKEKEQQQAETPSATTAEIGVAKTPDEKYIDIPRS